MTMIGKRDNLSLTPYHYGTVGSPMDSHVMFRRSEGNGDMNMYNAELGYTHTFTDKHKIDFSLSYNKWKNDDSNYYRDSTTYFDPVAPTAYAYQYRPMLINNNSWEAKLDYENQITENIKVEADTAGASRTRTRRRNCGKTMPTGTDTTWRRSVITSTASSTTWIPTHCMPP